MIFSNSFTNDFISKLSKKSFWVRFALILGFLTWFLFYINGVMRVPFHPDEATQIFMSADVDTIFAGDVNELFYDSARPDDPAQKYRLLDSPVTKYIIGFARNIRNIAPLLNDWDWSKTWQQNSMALPEAELLQTARYGIAILLPISILMYFFLVQKAFSFPMALISTLLLMTHSLVLLHTRRAMAESGLLFFMILSLLALLKLPNKWLFLAALPVAFAFNAKQSLFPLIIVGLVVIIWRNKLTIRNLFLQFLLFLALFGGVFYLLNPVLWQQPFQVCGLMVQARQKLTADQVAGISSVSPGFVMRSPGQRLVALIGQTFVTSPAVQDVANYENELQAASGHYFANPLHIGFGRNPLMGVIFLLLTAAGSLLALREKDFNKGILLLAFVLLLGEFLILLPIPFQRYYLPLIPFTILFSAFAVTTFVANLIQRFTAKAGAAETKKE